MTDSTKANSKPGTKEWLTGGEMGKAIREMDWSQTPLGPIEQWPQSLRTTVSLCLASNFPISIVWGPGRVQIYNDGYWPICGDKHPHSMGQDFKECWFSAWPVIGEAFEQASVGQTAFLVNQRMFLDRHGYLEETFFTFSFSPILDESGGVGGLFHPVIELTQQSLAERRLKVLRDVADHAAEAKAVEEACAVVTQTLARHELDVPFALLYLLDADGQQARLAASAGLAAGSIASPKAVGLETLPDPCWPFTREQQVVEVTELERRFGPLSCGPYPEAPQTAFVLPINVSGLAHPFGLLVAGVSARRALDEAYRTFFLLLREGVTNALTNARAYEEERKRAEALAELDRAKTAFFSNVSHEFRTPLTLMLGPLEETLAQNNGLPAADRERLQVAHRNSLRLLKLVNTLLDFSRIEAGRIEAVYEPTDLAAYTAELSSVFRSAIEKAGMKLSVDCPPLAEPIWVDREMWEKIVLNLLSNAFKFTFAGQINVTLKRVVRPRPHGQVEAGESSGAARAVGQHAREDAGASCVEFTVRDTGTGIPAGELAHVFERFHRVKGARGRSYEGSGIGLALVEELVKLHGGEVRVESEVDRGTAFTVSVPTGYTHLPAERIGTARTLSSTGLRGEAYVEEVLRWLPEGTVQSTDFSRLVPYVQQQPPEGGTQNTRARLLLADDNADMREYIRRLLSREYEVVAVADGAAALRAAREESFDLVLADVMMPQLDGFALLKELRADERTRTLPVILLSARAGEESRIEGLAAGADDYLIKPFSARELLARVAAHLQLQRVRRESAARETELRREAEAARAQSENILSSIRDAFSALDRDWRYTYINYRGLELTGLRREAFIGRTLWEVFPDLVGTEFEARLQRAMEGRAATHFEHYYPAWNRWLENRVYPSADGLSLFISDITERKQAEEQLRQSEERFRAFTNATSDAVYCMTPDWTEMRHLQGREFIADTLEPSRTWLEKYIHPDDQPRVMEAINRAIQTRSIFELEHRVIRIDGTLGWTYSRAIPVLNVQGEIIEWFGAASDVTQRKAAEEKLRQADLRLRDITDSTAALIWQTDATGVTFVNRHYLEFFGVTFDAVKGMGWDDFLHPDDAAGYVAAYQMAYARQEGYEYQGRFRRQDGEYRWLRSVGTPHLGADGSFLGFVGNSTDITEIKEAELNTRFLVDLDKQLGTLSEPEEIEQTTINQLGQFLRASHCYFAYLYDNERGVVAREYRAPEVSVSLIAEHMMTAYNPPDRIAQFLRGETVVNNDVVADAGTAAHADNFALFQIRAFASTPVYFGGECVGILNVTSHTPRIWREDELELLREVVSRVRPLLERARAVAELRESKARFDIVKDGAQVGFWFCDLPFDKLIWDNRVKEHFWLPPDAAVTIDTFYEQIHPADRERTRQAIDESIANRTQYDIEYRTLSPDGQEKWIRAIGRTFYDAQANPIRFDGVTLDITERLRAEEALRESEERFRNMADHAPMMIWVTDPDASCTYLSKSWYEFTGQTPATGLGLGWLDATHPDDRALATHVFLAANEKYEAFRLDYRLRRADGSYAWAIDSATPRFGPDGEFLGYIGSVLDITERKDMEEALKENDRRKDEFLAMLAHELRNPLAPIRNATQVLKLTGPADTNQQWACEVIERQTQHMTRLVDDLLDVSRITQGKIALQREPLELATIINRAVEASRPLMDARRHRLTVALPHETAAPVRVEGDLTRLVQVISNLVNNAAKYTDEGGLISIAAAAEDGEAVVRVRDNGMGLAADLLPYVFDLFTQADRSLDRSQGGLGIGLTLVRRLVEMHGGRVEARSKGPGRGSEFVVRLPVMQSAECGVQNAEGEGSAIPHSAFRTPHLRVLVIEDNVDSAEMLSFMLKLGGHETHLAYDGLAALDAARAFLPQVILCDIGLPGRDGYEVARQLRAEPEFKHTRLIALSGYGQDEDRRRAKQAGFDYHLTKPVDPDALAALLNSLRSDGRAP